MAAPPPNPVPLAYQGGSPSVPDWLNKGDNAWQMISATLVGLQSVPGLVILYGSIVKKKWAVNSAFMAFYAFAAVVICWVCVFAAITLILLAGSVLGRMNFKAWMAFVPLWLTFSYTVGAFSLWGGGFLFHWGVMDYSGGYVIHLSSGIAGLTTAFWPREPLYHHLPRRASRLSTSSPTPSLSQTRNEPNRCYH
ncbi:hypothetical protein POTOM_057848 [Populus tomentosa]|uniref:Ammonium transporter AmtB-like domain-containing protein n=1 Tax=Populus tomentosa TaxID=118781 RepID=A0A8X7XU83_POPTO|nr:hypothetical protein POTOM_057848 [Populus tomentosa]